MTSRMFYTDRQVLGLDGDHDPAKDGFLSRHTRFRNCLCTHNHMVAVIFSLINLALDNSYILLFRNPLDNLISHYYYAYTSSSNRV